MAGLERPSRRAILAAAAAAGGVGLASRVSPLFAQDLTPTPSCRDGDEPTEEQIEGPYFKPRSPERFDLTEAGSRALPLQLEGLVLTRSCRPVPAALMDMWHANENGDYDMDTFHYRGHLYSDAQGGYRFRTIIPAPYPGRTRHYHLKVQAPGRPILTTQLYFPNEFFNALDGLFSPALVMDVARDSKLSFARFDFVLDLP